MIEFDLLSLYQEALKHFLLLQQARKKKAK